MPIFKKGKKCELNNYRPVSLTSSVCKIFESIVRDNLLEHFKQNKYFSDREFGFLKGRSTVTQLLYMCKGCILTLFSKQSKYFPISCRWSLTRRLVLSAITYIWPCVNRHKSHVSHVDASACPG